MSPTRIGVSVHAGELRIVVLRGRRLVAAAGAELDSASNLEDAVTGLLRSLSLPRIRQPTAAAVLGPSRFQLRSLSGLPATTDARLLATAIRQEPGRFFLRNGVPLATTGFRVTGPGEGWAAALEEPAITAIRTGCAAAGVRLEAAAPDAAALAPLLPDGTHRWADGPVVIEMETAGGMVAAVRRRFRGTAAVEEAPPPAPASAQEGLTADFSAAYAAARLPRENPLAVWFPVGDIPVWRVRLAASAVVVAAVLAFLLPLRRAQFEERAAAAELRRLAAAEATASLEADALAAVTGALQEVAEFSAGRRSAVDLVGELEAALPEGTALVSIRTDSTGGSLTVLSPRAADVLAELDSVPQLTGLAIAGAVTREVAAGQPLERVTLRFRWGAGGRL